MERDTQRMRVDEDAFDAPDPEPSNESCARTDVTDVTTQPPVKASEFTYATEPGKTGNTLRLIADGLRHSQERREAAAEAARIEAIRSTSASAPLGASNPLDLPPSPSEGPLTPSPSDSATEPVKAVPVPAPGVPRPTIPRGRVWLYSPLMLVFGAALALLVGVVITAAALMKSTVPSASTAHPASASAPSPPPSAYATPPITATQEPSHPPPPPLATSARTVPHLPPLTSAALLPATTTIPIASSAPAVGTAPAASTDPMFTGHGP